MSDALSTEQRRQALEHTCRRASGLSLDAICTVHAAQQTAARADTAAAAVLERVAGHLDEAWRELRELSRLIAA
jgi:hypothetical protein